MSARLEQLEKLLKAEPDDVFLNFGRAMELAKLQRYDESLAQFGRVLELDPAYTAAHFQRAKTYLSMGDVDTAKSELQAGIRQAASIGNTHAQGEMQELLDSL